MAFFLIHGMVRRNYGKMGTFANGVYHGLSGGDAIRFGGNGLGKHDAVPLADISADDGGNLAQVNGISGGKPLKSRPA